MIVFFAPILVIIGFAYLFRGRPHRGLIVFAVALATDLALFVALERWAWVAFTAAWLAVCLISLAFVKKAP